MLLLKKPFLLPAVVICLLSCNSEPDTLFKRHSPDETGIHFTNQLDYNDPVTVLEFEYMFNGGGVALIDINNDSLQDIIFTGNMVSSRLYLNKGNLQFEDITEKAGVTTQGWSNGVAVVDINQDGFQDFYVCKAGNYKTPVAQMRNLFFINNGNNTFTESAEKMGLAEEGYDIQAAFFDYDKDGDLDMYLLRNAFVKYNRNDSRYKTVDGSAASTDRLFRNNGDLTFTDVSKQSGVTIEGFGLGVNICDLNNDNWPDVYVSNDFLSNDLMWINNQNGTFTNRAKDYLQHQTYNGMGNDVADYNNDGLPDIIVLDMLPPDNRRWKLTMAGNGFDEYEQNLAVGYEPQFVRNTLQLNNGDGTFSEIGRIAGVDATEWSWGPLFADFDNDGWKDLFIANGFRQDINNLDFVWYGIKESGVRETFTGTPDQYRKKRLETLHELPGVKVHNYLFKNDRDLKFSDASVKWGMTTDAYTNGGAFGDLDNDGDLDLVVNSLDGPSFIYENRASTVMPEQGWLRINFKGPKGNSGGFGAKVWIWQNGKMQFSNMSPYRGYLSTVEQTLHFGIQNTDVDSLKVLWPDGNEQVLKSIKPKQSITLHHREANIKAQREPSVKQSSLFSSNASTGIQFKHIENIFVDFKLQPLLPHMHSRGGPGLAVGDANGDGREDLYIGGASGYKGSLYLQQPNGKFVAKQLPEPNDADNMGVLFFDADSDGDADLYVSSGGTSIAKKDNQLYKHRLYINDGKANFTLMQDALPSVITPASSVIAADYDRDGDLDLFVCGRVSPGEYPLSPKSFLLRNDSENKQCRFADVSNSSGDSLSALGMVTSALWTDFDNDGWIDLLVAGEFMPLKFFKNEKGKFRDVSKETGLANTSGWWNSLASGDFDKDGDIDYIAGNLGLNGPYKASAEEPVCIYASDYDRNGRIDPIMCHFEKGKEYPVHSRDDMNRQISSMRGRFKTYHSYATATFQEALKPEEIEKAYVVKAETFESSYIENLGNGKFKIHALPLEAQFSPLFAMLANDFDGDGNTDVLGVGNSYSTESQTGRYDAQGTLFLKGDGKGNFRPERTALNLQGDNKSIVSMNLADGNSLIVIGTNSDSVKLVTGISPGKSVKLLPGDAYALITGTDNRTYRQEFYYGHSYLSQGSRTFSPPANAKAITIYNYSGATRDLK
ncbi:MAG: VCBS repeat-containing protein [Chitinophagaceae bacterium]|nr:VCBS repeat-containing protein [Chitinophagaceae bacterium]